MFKIYADKDLLYESDYPERLIARGEFDLEVNRSGSFTFQLYPGHPLYDALTELKTTVTAYQDDDLMYRGRIIRRPDGFNLDRTFICEGELSFLVDSKVRPYSFQGSPAAMFRQLIEAHNTQVAEDRRFEVGVVTVTDPNDYITRANSSYPTTYAELMDKLVEPLGGYIVFSSGDNGKRVINWLAAYPVRDRIQGIDFGENLLDYTNTRSAETVATALIPLGAKVESESEDIEPRLTVASVNDGKDYIYDEAAVARYGWIYETEIWDDVTLPENLLARGRAYLDKLTMPTESIELSALDMSALDKDISAFRLGDVISVRSEPHNLDAAYLLSKQTIDVLRPEANKITLGYTGQTLTFATLSTSKIGSQVGALSEAREQDSAAIVSIQKSIKGIDGDITQIKTDQATDLERLTQMYEDLNTKVEERYIYRNAIDSDNQTIGADSDWGLGRHSIKLDGYVAEEIAGFGVYGASNGGTNANWCVPTRLFVWDDDTIDVYIWNQNKNASAKVRIIIRVKYRKL